MNLKLPKLTRNPTAIILVLLAVLVGSGAVGCSAMLGPSTITAPMDLADPVTVHIVDYGRHSSLVLPNSAGELWEYTFGDYRYFTYGPQGWADGPRAIFFSDGSTFARRNLGTIVDAATVQGRVGGTPRLLTLQVERSLALSLKDYLDDRYNAGQGPEILSTYSNLLHVRDAERYWLLNNCNHLTARWLVRLGARVVGPTVLSNFRFDSASLAQGAAELPDRTPNN